MTAESPPLKVLLAEDDVINQQVEQSLLLKLGCDVTVVEDGMAALEAWRANHYDLIFMDCNMPELDGYGATEQIRAFEEKNQVAPIPIIALTASSSKEDCQHCLNVGMTEYITKPLKIDTLRQIIQKYNPDNSVVTTPPPPATPAVPAPVATPNISTTERSEVSTRQPKLNSRTLERLRQELSPKSFQLLVDLYLSELPNYIHQLQQGMMTQNSQGIYLAAHKLRGSSSSMGADELSALCKKIEEATKNADKSVDFTTLNQQINRLVQLAENYTPTFIALKR